MEAKGKSTPPPRHDEAFKAGAVRMVTEQGHQPMEVANNLGICIDTLRSWLKSTGIQMGQARPSEQGAAAHADVFAYLKTSYNTICPHSALGVISPERLEARLCAPYAT